MRLLDATTQTFREFDDSYIPAYAILSHRWEDGEMTYQELRDEPAKAKRKKGFEKIQLCCRHALKEDLDYTWIDTCCIDKTSSAELSESINSMYRWYRNAAVCYAYLSDVQAPSESKKHDNSRRLLSNEEPTASEFRASKWWSRGRTLQELIAPQNLKFFANDGQEGWAELGGKRALLPLVKHITGIPRDILRGADVRICSTAMRMSWASDRETTRLEDRAYCLLGIFDVNMPLLYGEGKKAFLRLQEEIMKQSDDQTLFAWQHGSHYAGGQSLGPLASEASQFRGLGHLLPIRSTDLQSTYRMTHKGLEIDLPLIMDKGSRRATAILHCSSAAFFPDRIALPLVRVGDDDSNQFAREATHGPLSSINSKPAAAAVTKTIFINQESQQDVEWQTRTLVRFSNCKQHHYSLEHWSSGTEKFPTDDLERECFYVPSKYQKGVFFLKTADHSWLTVLFTVNIRFSGQSACQLKYYPVSITQSWNDIIYALEKDYQNQLQGDFGKSNCQSSLLYLPNERSIYANIGLKIVDGESMVVFDVDFRYVHDAPREPYELEAIPSSRAANVERPATYNVTTLIPPKSSKLSKVVSRALDPF
ncbi:heterokaryon incompatibility protein-domain-containing protein [Paraphoma chrysanthemicola]|uniref:Heterokaryon incompatibility protein-domain-containing protein n=1 Tax=Paraphoma chrysanthemicola TaxID=798071 RepID=A0A8K0R893_9PLEO|nr:heterokaryon incompatibility protein-domain-containing protein [Paraphoma chrysanthemicola]